jgi:hypothetical protein
MREVEVTAGSIRRVVGPSVSTNPLLPIQRRVSSARAEGVAKEAKRLERSQTASGSGEWRGRLCEVMNGGSLGVFNAMITRIEARSDA